MIQLSLILSWESPLPVKWTGGIRLAQRIREVTRLKDAADEAGQWFRGQRCLFLIDDIWWVNAIDSTIFPVLATLLHDEGMFVFTTRDKKFLRGADEEIRFKERIPQGELAQRILMTHAGFTTDAKFSSTNMEAVQGILEMCKGLPLALAITGATVQKYCGNRDVAKLDA